MLDLLFSRDSADRGGDSSAVQDWHIGEYNILGSPLFICSHFQDVSHVIILAVQSVVVTTLQFKINSGT